MSRPCQICQDPRAAEMEEEIASGKSIRGTADKFNVSNDALYRHMNFHTGMPGTASTASAGENTTYDPIAEIDHLLKKNKEALDGTRNSQVAQKLIAQQIALMETRQELVEKRAASQSNESQLNLDGLNQEELLVMIRIQNRAMGLHDEDVIKYGMVTHDSVGHVVPSLSQHVDR